MSIPFIKDSRNSNYEERMLSEPYRHVGYYKPNFCPFENMATQFIYQTNTKIYEYIDKKQTHNHLGIVFQCTSCGRFCLIDYDINDSSFCTPIDYPNTFSTDEFPFPEIIAEKFPKFKKIYIESEIAENNDLNEIDAMGYRKALEFLVEEFLLTIADNETEKETIKNNWLKANIDKLSALDPSLADNANMVAWIGNDKTHTKELHPDQTIDDMKNYLSVLTAYIAFRVQGKKGKKYMEDSKKSRNKQN